MTPETKSSGIKIPEISRIPVVQYCTRNKNKYEMTTTNPHVANIDGYTSTNSVTKYCYGCAKYRARYSSH